jgi:hypothetical protein
MDDVYSNNYDNMSLDQLATIREYGLEKLDTVTEHLKSKAREEHAAGDNIRRLARRASVTPRTMYKWLEE